MTVDGGGPPVKRRYDSKRRRAAADLTRRRVLEAAERAFLSAGYAATTIAGIAAEAQVSPDTIYKTFGGKPGLVRALYEDAIAGRAAVPAEERSDAIQREESDPRAILRAFGAFSAELSPRGAPLALLVRAAAAADPELEQLRRDIADSRFRRMTLNARRLKDAGHLRDGLSVQWVASVMWTYSSPELYELLVLERGLTPAEYGEFLSEAMMAAFL